MSEIVSSALSGVQSQASDVDKGTTLRKLSRNSTRIKFLINNNCINALPLPRYRILHVSAAAGQSKTKSDDLLPNRIRSTPSLRSDSVRRQHSNTARTNNRFIAILAANMANMER